MLDKNEVQSSLILAAYLKHSLEAKSARLEIEKPGWRIVKSKPSISEVGANQILTFVWFLIQLSRIRLSKAKVWIHQKPYNPQLVMQCGSRR